MPNSGLLLEVDAPIAILTLNRPERRNALSVALMREMIERLSGLEREKQVQVVILAAAGAVFCSGHDLSEMPERSEAEYRETFAVCTEMMAKIQAMPQPVIAEVQGVATAAGCQLVAACDLAVASEGAKFATPGVRIGLFCSTPMVALSRSIGRKRALEMLLTGEPIEAATAADWGLVNSVVPAADLRAETCKLARRIAEASRSTVAIGKRAFYTQIELAQEEAYALTSEVMTESASSGDANEGISAFLEKRAPCWPGK